MAMMLYSVRPSYWRYMALQMTRFLDEGIKQKCVRNNLIPKGILSDAQKLFELVRGAINYSQQIPFNPSACINAYTLAVQALKISKGVSTITTDDIHSQLSQHADFVDSLDRTVILDSDSISQAVQLKYFFEGLVSIGFKDLCLKR